MSDGTTARMAGPYDTQLGARLRAARRVRGLSQTELGQQLGVTFQQVQKYEKGTNRLSGSRLMKAAEVLGCSVSSLVGEQTDTPSPAILPGLSTEGAVELLEAYAAIRSADVRRKVVGLLRSMAKADAGGSGASDA